MNIKVAWAMCAPNEDRSARDGSCRAVLSTRRQRGPRGRRIQPAIPPPARGFRLRLPSSVMLVSTLKVQPETAIAG
jgi:hypothetical protein